MVIVDEKDRGYDPVQAFVSDLATDIWLPLVQNIMQGDGSMSYCEARANAQQRVDDFFNVSKNYINELLRHPRFKRVNLDEVADTFCSSALAAAIQLYAFKHKLSLELVDDTVHQKFFSETDTAKSTSRNAAKFLLAGLMKPDGQATAR